VITLGRKSCPLKRRLCPGSVVVGVCPLFKAECPNFNNLISLTEITNIVIRDSENEEAGDPDRKP
jgi:hypothetical protein